MKKSIKTQIWKALEKTGYLTDTDVAKIYGEKDLNFVVAEEYKRQWCRFKSDREFFADKKIKQIVKANRKHYVELEDGLHYKCGKDFFDFYGAMVKKI